MRISTLIGILLGGGAILFAFFIENGHFYQLILPAPIIIVIGGTLFAGLASSSWDVFSRMLKLIWIAFFPKKYDKKKITFQILEFSLITRQNGMLALDSKLKTAEHPYIQKIFQIGIDGANVEDLEEMYYIEIERLSFRHSENISFFHKLGGLSPTMGIIGTVMGLISTMSEAGGDADASRLIIAISVAFLATLWGIAMANIVWIPIADRLQTIHNEEIQMLNMIFEGTKCIFKGDHSTILTTKLSSAYPLDIQSEFINEAKKFLNIQREKIKER